MYLSLSTPDMSNFWIACIVDSIHLHHLTSASLGLLGLQPRLMLEKRTKADVHGAASHWPKLPVQPFLGTLPANPPCRRVTDEVDDSLCYSRSLDGDVIGGSALVMADWDACNSSFQISG
jgi:hypothetical protein